VPLLISSGTPPRWPQRYFSNGRQGLIAEGDRPPDASRAGAFVAPGKDHRAPNASFHTPRRCYRRVRLGFAGG
jgi:hypothetical protein